MLTLVNIFRTFLVVVTCLVLSACTQTNTATNSYNGINGANSSIEKSRQAKIQAARKRARATRLAERKKFLKKRNRRHSKNRSYRHKGTRVSSRSGSRSYSKHTSNGRVKRLKTTSYGYVGGRSKGIRRNSKPWRCVPGRLKKVLRQISKKYGRVTINSTHRSRRHNRRVGGKRRSYHLRCQAVDFRVHGRTRGLTRWLAKHPLVGGYNRYPSGYYHIDTGPKRTW